MAHIQFELTKKQGQLLAAFKERLYGEILFGGGARSGKTFGICTLILMLSIEYPGIVWGIGREEVTDLKKTVVVTLMKVLTKYGFRRDRDYTYNSQAGELVFKNGSKVYLIALKQQPSDPDFNWLGGYELTYMYVDEGQEVSRKAIDVLKSRLTEKIAEYKLKPIILISCNPSKGHLYSDFIRPKKEELEAKGRIFIQSLYLDNPHINHKEYEAALENADKATKERLLKGNWDYDDSDNKIFKTDEVEDMFRTTYTPDHKDQKYISADIARLGGDKIIFFVWQKNHVLKCVVKQFQTIDVTANDIRQLEITYQVRRSNIIIDTDGVGGGVADILKGSKGFTNNASAVQPEEAKLDISQRVNYKNLKTQCYFKLHELAARGDISFAEDAFDDVSFIDLLKQELDVIREKQKKDDGKIELISKEDMKKILNRSPDFADALMMKMYFNVYDASIGISDSGTLKTNLPGVTTITRRKFFNRFTGNIADIKHERKN